jgi:DnaK suppressor protein
MAKKASEKKEEVKKTTKAAKTKNAAKSTKSKATKEKKATTTKKTAAKKATTKKASTAKKTKSAKENSGQVITAGRITIKRPTRNSDPFIITTASGNTIKGYSPKDLEEFKEIIVKRRDEIIEQLRLLKEQMMDPNTGEYVNENSPYSLHMAEQGTDSQEREKLFLWAQRESKFLRYLEDALQRIELGTYGICVDCMDDPKKLCPTCPLIPKERLRAVPHTQHCVQVKQQLQK